MAHLLFLLLLPLSVLADTPRPQGYGASVLVGTTLWVFGGFVQDADYPSFGITSNQLWSLDLSKPQNINSPLWTDHTSDGASISFVNHRAYTDIILGFDKKTLYIYGGDTVSTSTESQSINEIIAYDTVAHTWSLPTVNGDVPPPLGFMSVASDAKEVAYYFGGKMTNYTSPIANDTIIRNDAMFTLKTDFTAFTIMTPPSWVIGRVGHTATMVYGTQMFIIGGYTLDQKSASSVDMTSHYVDLSYNLVYDTIHSTWSAFNTTSPQYPPIRKMHTAVLSPDGNSIIIFGGVSATIAGIKFYNDVWVLDVGNSTWRSVQTTGPIPGPRAYHNAAVIGTQMVVVFGDDSLTTSYPRYGDTNILELSTNPWTWVNTLNVSVAPPPPPPPTTTNSTTPTTIPDNNGLNMIGGVGGAVGIALGGAAFLCTLGFIAWFYKKSRRASLANQGKWDDKNFPIIPTTPAMTDQYIPVIHDQFNQLGQYGQYSQPNRQNPPVYPSQKEEQIPSSPGSPGSPGSPSEASQFSRVRGQRPVPMPHTTPIISGRWSEITQSTEGPNEVVSVASSPNHGNMTVPTHDPSKDLAKPDDVSMTNRAW